MVIIEAMEGLDLTISLEVDRIFSEAKDFCYRKRFKGKQFDVLHETETILRGKVSEIDAQIKLWDEQIHSARANALDLTVVHAMNTVKVDMDKKRNTLTQDYIPRIISAEMDWLCARITPEQLFKVSHLD